MMVKWFGGKNTLLCAQTTSPREISKMSQTGFLFCVVMICSCSDKTTCNIGDGGDSTSHGVCPLIDDMALTATRSAVSSAAATTIALMATRSAAVLAASNDVFIRSIRLYPRGHKTTILPPPPSPPPYCDRRSRGCISSPINHKDEYRGRNKPQRKTSLTVVSTFVATLIVIKKGI